MGGAEQVVGALAVGEAEQRVAVIRPSPARLEDLARDERGQEHLLPADGGHLLAHHLLDVAQRHQAQRQPGGDTRTDPAHISGTDEQPMAGDVRVGRIVAKRAQEQGRESDQHGRTVSTWLSHIPRHPGDGLFVRETEVCRVAMTVRVAHAARNGASCPDGNRGRRVDSGRSVGPLARISSCIPGCVKSRADHGAWGAPQRCGLLETEQPSALNHDRSTVSAATRSPPIAATQRAARSASRRSSSRCR